ncbi:MAG: sugar phosphate isomerase/epimerase family protein [Armatimonadia bacterium]
MEFDLRIDAATTSFSTCADRFVKSGYKEAISFPRQLELLASVPGITGVALDYPSQYDDPVALRALLDPLGLELGMTEIDMYSSVRWQYGSLSSLDDATRTEAIGLVKRGIDAAVEARGADVQLWLGQDGYEYPFATDYNEAWARLADAVIEIVEYRPDMKITIEYKAKEPRTKCFISTVGRALYLCERAGKANAGVTLDVGHSLMAGENPAEAAVMALQRGRLFHLHLNDNYRDWDHDMIPGTVNLWDSIELFYWLERLGFDGWYGIDVYPYREDGAATLNRTVQSIYRFREIARRLIAAGLPALQTGERAIEVIDLVMAEVLK